MVDQVHRRWIASAIEQQMLDAADAAQILLAASESGESLPALVERQLANDPGRLAGLRLLLRDTETRNGARSGTREGTPAPASPLSSALEADHTLAGYGQSSLANGSEKSAFPPSTDSRASTPDAAPDQATSTGPRNAASPSTGRGSAGFSRATRARKQASSAVVSSLRNLPTALLRYELDHELGRGGCGVVSTARDRQLERDVVVKKMAASESLNDETIHRFYNEAKITGQLEHPGVVPVYEVGVDEAGMPWYAMKQVRGKTLAQKIEEYNQLPVGRAKQQLRNQLLQRFLDVCQTVAFAHQKGIIHRDLKPANIMIGEFGETLLLDWGLAREVRPMETDNLDATQAGGTANGADSASHVRSRGSGGSDSNGNVDLTRQGTVVGTAAYMAPEQARGQNRLVGRHSDVFSLGVILYELLTGVSPFRCDTLDTTIERVGNCRYRPLREYRAGIPRALAAICQTAMHPERQKRYATAVQLAEDVQNYLSGGTVSVYREKFWERFDRLANNHRALFRTGFFSTLGLAVAAVTAVGAISQSNQLEREARAVATRSRNQAELALQSEQVTRQHWYEQMLASRDAADQWLIQLSGDLQFYPGLASVRRDLLHQGLEHYERLVDAADDLPENEIESAQCQIRLGDLQRLLGEADKAAEHYTSAIDMAKLALQGDSQSDAQIALANGTLGLALVALEAHHAPSSGSSNLDAPNLTRLDSELSTLLQSEPDHGEARNALVRCRLIQARTDLANGDTESAVALIRKALPDAEILLQLKEDPRHRRLKLTLLEDLARSLAQSGNTRESIEAWNEVRRFLDRLQQGQSSRPDLHQSRAQASAMIGNSWLHLGEYETAVEAFAAAESALQSSREIVFGEAGYRDARAVLTSNQGRALYGINRFSDAQLAYQRSVADLRWLVENDGVNNDRIYRMACSYLWLAQSLWAQGDDQMAEYLQQNRLLIEHLVASSSDDDWLQPRIVWLQLDQHLCELEIAMSLRDESRIRASSEALHAAVEVANQDTSIDTASLDWYRANCLAAEATCLAREKGFEFESEIGSENGTENGTENGSLSEADSVSMGDWRERHHAALTLATTALENDGVDRESCFALLLYLHCGFPAQETAGDDQALTISEQWCREMPNSRRAWLWRSIVCRNRRNLSGTASAVKRFHQLSESPLTPWDAQIMHWIEGESDSKAVDRVFDGGKNLPHGGPFFRLLAGFAHCYQSNELTPGPSATVPAHAD